MAIPFLNHLDLQDISQLQNAILHKTTSGVASTAAGKIIFDTGTATIKYYDGSAWVELVGDTDNFVDSLDFNTSDGILTVGRTGSLSDLTVDLDGRYQLAGNYDNYQQWQITDGSQTDDVTTDQVVKFAANSTPGTAGAALTGSGTTGDPYLITYTFPNDNDDNYVDAASLTGSTLTLERTGSLADITVDLSALDDTVRTVAVDTDGDGTVNNTLADSEDLVLKKGANITLTESGGVVTIASTNTDVLQGIYTPTTNADNDFYISFVENNSGTQVGYVDGGLRYNPSTDTLVVQNITVSGTSTTVNTETINLADNIITLNSNEEGTPSQDAGIEVERGASSNVQLNWNEADDDWEFTAYNHAATPALTTYKIPRTYSEAVGNGSLTSIAVDHNLGTRNVIVQLFDTNSYETVYADVVRTDGNTVTLTFASAPATGDITVLISTAGA